MIRQPWFVFVVAGSVAFGVGAALLAAGIGPPASAAGERPRLSVTGAYIPQPGTPAEVAAYATVRNAGGSADRLLGVRTDVSTIVMLHQGAARDMADMQTVGAVPLPAHRRVELADGGLHIMIMQPARALRVGDSVRLTLVFARSDPLTVSAPVVQAGDGPPGAQSGHHHHG
ncbi:MAG TPA: copper chaperone PCu(A)C [Streptosporangiaceae bacterium]|jgi:hypothetical protein